MKRTMLLIAVLSTFPVLLFSQNNNKIDSLEQFLEHAPNDFLKLETLKQLADAYVYTDFKKTLYYGEQGLTLSRKLGNDEVTAYGLNQFGHYYSQNGDFEKGLRYIEESLSIAKKIKNRGLIGQAYRSLCALYRSTRDYKKALEYAHKALGIYQKEKNKKEEIYILMVLGDLSGGDQNGYSYYSQAKKIAIEINDSLNLDLVSSKIATDYMDNAAYDSALVLLLENKKFRESMGFERGLISIYKYLGEVYLELKQVALAEMYFNKSLKIAKDYNDRMSLIQIYGRYSEFYYRIGNYKLAYEAALNYKAYSDSVFNEEKSDQIVEMQTKFETTQKENENVLLRKESEIQEFRLNAAIVFSSVMVLLAVLVAFLYLQLRKNKNKLEKQTFVIRNKNKELDRLNQTKDRFFAIIAHDLRGPITAFQGIAKKMDFFLRNDRMDRILRMGEQIDTAAQHISTLLDNLLNWALLQQGAIPVKKQDTDLSEVIIQVLGNYENMAQANEVMLEMDIPENLTVKIDVNSVSTIIRNLVGNALKFTPAHGKVSIAVKEKMDSIELSVRDTGIGMSSGKVQQLFQVGSENSTTGLRGEQGTGIGLTLCQEFAKLNDSSLEVKSELNQGTIFTLSFPKNIENTAA